MWQLNKQSTYDSIICFINIDSMNSYFKKNSGTITGNRKVRNKWILSFTPNDTHWVDIQTNGVSDATIENKRVAITGMKEKKNPEVK